MFRPSYCRARRLTTRWRVRLAIRCTPVKRLRSSWRLVLLRLSCWSTTVTSSSSLTRKCVQEISHRRNAFTISRLTSEANLVVSVALLVVRRTNNRKVLGSRPANVVCVTVLTGNRLGWRGELTAVAGHHSFFRAVRSWSLDCQRWWTRIWHG